MTARRAPAFARSESDRVVAGVCGGLAETLGVDATLVRLVFALLALAGGAGVLLYLAFWTYGNRGRPWVAGMIAAVAAGVLLVALGLSTGSVFGLTLLVAGILIIVVRGGTMRPGGSLPVPAVALLLAGAVVFLSTHGRVTPLVAPGALAGALVLIVGPWIWQLAADRTARIRLEERANVAARVHDSVLQTLALVQRHAADPARVTALARRQERDLRRWLYGGGLEHPDGTLVDALGDAAGEIEELHGARIELAASGDVPLADEVEQLVLAAREAMTNAAKFSHADEIAVFAEIDAERIAVYIRDRGVGFEPDAVPADRHGLTDSIHGRMRRAGGNAVVTSAPGAGTEVELTLPRRPS